MGRKYDKLLERLHTFKETREQRESGAAVKRKSTAPQQRGRSGSTLTVTLPGTATRRETFLISNRSTAQTAAAGRRKTIASGSSVSQRYVLQDATAAGAGSKRKSTFEAAGGGGGPSSKRAKEDEDAEMRQKLEEWRKKREQPKVAAPTNTERRRTFIPTGPYGVSFGFDLPADVKPTSSRKSIGASRKSLTASRKSLPASQTSVVPSHKSLPLSRKSHPQKCLPASRKSLAATSVKSRASPRLSVAAGAITGVKLGSQVGVKPVPRKSIVGFSATATAKATGWKKAFDSSKKVSTGTSKNNVRATTTTQPQQKSQVLYDRIKCSDVPKPIPKRVLSASTAKENTIDRTPHRISKEALTKKKKLKFVQARTDTGLVGVKRATVTAATKKQESGKSLDNRPVWKFTPKVSSMVVSRLSVKSECPTVPTAALDQKLPQQKGTQVIQNKKWSTAQNKKPSLFPASVVRLQAALEKREKKKVTIASDKHRSILKVLPAAAPPPQPKATAGSAQAGAADCRVRFAEKKVENVSAPATAAAGILDENDQQKFMRERLDKWLTEHGKTPSKYSTLRNLHTTGRLPHPLKATPTQQQQTRKQELHLTRRSSSSSSIGGSMDCAPPAFPDIEEDAEDEEEDPVFTKMDQLLSECLLLLDSGCPVSAVSAWLDEVVRGAGLPTAHRCAKYWICRARLEEAAPTTGPNAAAARVIDIYEEAIRQQVKNPDEIAEALKQFVGRLGGRPQDAPVTPLLAPVTPRCRRRSSLQQLEPDAVVFRSSTIKYNMMEATTPFFKRLRSRVGVSGGGGGGGDTDGVVTTPLSVVTPVRRSTRVFTPHRVPEEREVEDLRDLPDHLHLLYRRNDALMLQEEEDRSGSSSGEEEEGPVMFEGSYLLE